MRRRFVLLGLLLMMILPARAEDVPMLQERFPLTALPAGENYRVFSGPGTWYHVAADGRARVSSGGDIWCYGTTRDGWLMIEYETNAGAGRVGYIQAEMKWPVAELEFGSRALWVEAETAITDDPHGKANPIGMVHGAIEVLALQGKWAYVEGLLTGTGNERVRGFVLREDLPPVAETLDIPVSPYAGERYRLMNQYSLKLPDNAVPYGMSVYPLPDDTLLIAYHCEGSDRLWLRVISETGRKLWAKSVPELYLSQIKLTELGFICQTFDNSECDSGKHYTYVCDGRKWVGRSIRWIEEAERFYCDNTDSFTLHRHTFHEGRVVPVTLINRAAGRAAENTILTFKPFMYEMDGALLLVDQDEEEKTVLRLFDGDLQGETRIPMPEAIGEPHEIHDADHDRNAVYFFTGYGEDWAMWRFDRDAQTFAAEPVIIAVPKACTLTPIAVNNAGLHDLLMQTAGGSYLCQLQPDGTLLLHQALEGEAAWISTASMDDSPDETLLSPRDSFLVILQKTDGTFVLQRYEITEG